MDYYYCSPTVLSTPGNICCPEEGSATRFSAHTERWFARCLESQVPPSLSDTRFLLEGEGVEEEECGRQEGSENFRVKGGLLFSFADSI